MMIGQFNVSGNRMFNKIGRDFEPAGGSRLLP